MPHPIRVSHSAVILVLLSLFPEDVRLDLSVHCGKTLKDLLMILEAVHMAVLEIPDYLRQARRCIYIVRQTRPALDVELVLLRLDPVHRISKVAYLVKQPVFAGADIVNRSVGLPSLRGTTLGLLPALNTEREGTSESNRQFDRWLKARDPRSGIRDIEAIHALAAQAGLEPQADHAMPSNNRLLLWRKASAFA
jgi:hypothetical protein